nr:hypothetical protein [Tanacetum cinerariifolium]
MYVLASPEHVPAIPDQLPVEPPLAPNSTKLDNDYLYAIDYDNDKEPYEDLDDDEEDPKEDPKMDLDEEEEDPEMDIDDEEEEEPILASHHHCLHYEHHLLCQNPLLILIFLLPLLPLWVDLSKAYCLPMRIMPPKRMSNAAIEGMIADRVAATLAAERTAIAVEAA